MKTHGNWNLISEMPQNYSLSIKREPNSFNPNKLTTIQHSSLTMSSWSPPSSPIPDVNYPHLVFYEPLSEYQPSIITIPNSPTYKDKQVQTTPKKEPCPIHPQNITPPTLPNPSMTLQQREPPDLPTLLRLRDLLQDEKLHTPMIAHCDLHSPILNLYKSYCFTMGLREHYQFEKIKMPAQSELIHALYQLDALPFLKNLKEAPWKHGKRTFCTMCYHLGHFKKDCPFYQCPHCSLHQSHHDEDQCLKNPQYSGSTIIKQESPSPPQCTTSTNCQKTSLPSH